MKGFTLVELLIFIAIIGILASIVLVSVFSARQKAADSRIRNNIAQLRWEAEIVYDTQGASFDDWSTHPSVSQQVNILLDDIVLALKGAGAATVRDTDNDTYCVSAPLVSISGRHYCVDAGGVFAEVTAPCPATAPFECPAS
jgi:prepilin-type N-terminal cleavage/methylation domain-containing protein